MHSISRPTLFVLLLCLSITYACTGPKSLTKKGNKLSEVGMHQEAINYYTNALEKKPNYIPAQIALKNSSTIFLNELSGKFSKSYYAKDDKTAVYTFLEMEKLVDLVNQYKTNLSINPSHQIDYENAKESYLKSRFEAANKMIGEDKFNEALCVFEEIETLDPKFKGKDFETLKEMAKLEPHYRKGKEEFNHNQFRKAYYAFKTVADQNPNYKDVRFKLQDALNNAQFNIGVLQFENLSNEWELSDQMSSSISQEIIAKNSPFVKLIDRSNTNLIKEEQLMNLKGITKNKTGAKAGELISAHVFLSAKILSCVKSFNAPRAKIVNAYESYQVKKYDAVNKKNYYETEYRKVRYKEFYGYNEVMISFQIQLVSAETSEILLSETINKQTKSEVNYASYNGNFNNLVPGTWISEFLASPQDRINTGNSEVRALQNKFKANKTATSIDVLKSEIQEEIAKIAAEKIIAFNPEEIKQ